VITVEMKRITEIVERVRYPILEFEVRETFSNEH
jgi:hypothetical protein